MSKDEMRTLKFYFEGLILLVPEKPFKSKPTHVDVVVRDLTRPATCFLPQSNLFLLDGNRLGTTYIRESHHAWLEVEKGTLQAGKPREKKFLAFDRFVEEGGKRRLVSSVDALQLNRMDIEIRPDGAVVSGPLSIDPSLLKSLPTYRGALKSQFKVPSYKSLPKLGLASRLRLVGGSLAVRGVDLSQYSYEALLPGGNSKIVAKVPIAVEWSVQFKDRVDLVFQDKDGKETVTLKTPRKILKVSLFNSELERLFAGRSENAGESDDGDYSVYGDSLVDGSPSPLEIGSIYGKPSGPGTKACGVGGAEV